MKKGLLVALAHVAMVLAVAGKFNYDRSALPRVWTRAAPYDPSTPLRGRYVSLSVEASPVGSMGTETSTTHSCRLEVKYNMLVCVADLQSTNQIRLGQPSRLLDPVLFFIPEHIPDPSIRAEGEELWVELTIPRHGPPRPIQLAVRKQRQLVPLRIN